MNEKISTVLKKEFDFRRKKNVRYSLRAFSRDMKMSPGFLSDVLKNKKKLSIDKTLQISQCLGWSLRDARLLLQTAQLGQAKTKRARKFLRSELDRTSSVYGQFERLKIVNFSKISEWYFVAILELTDKPDFKDDPTWIAQQLNISVSNVKTALEKLTELGLIEKSENSGLKKTTNMTVGDVPTSSDIRKFHRQQLHNAAIAIESQSTSNRHLSGVTMAIDRNKLPEAIELISEFRSRMSALLEAGEKNSVYHLAIQLFQLDEGQLKK